jgi:hypothetical protein
MKELLQLCFGMSPLRNNDYGEDAEKKASEPRWILAIRTITYSAVILAVTGVVAYRLAKARFNFSQFDFSQLLSMLLALFSIGLSATFYFKATDTSNRFYDRTYRLTKDLFEILGRIEERFGEQLKGIHEDTSATRLDFSQSKGGAKIVTETAATAPQEIKSSQTAEEKS